MNIGGKGTDKGTDKVNAEVRIGGAVVCNYLQVGGSEVVAV